VHQYNLEFTILKAQVTPREEGLLVLELKGKKTEYELGVRYLKKAGVTIQPLSQDIKRNESRCTNCGVCVPMCPVNALVVDPETRRVDFNDTLCIACEICIKACPVRAMEAHF
jgi:ferredoxin